MSNIFTDIEVFHGFYYLGLKREEDGKRVGVEWSTRNPNYDRDYVRSVISRNTTIGFNSLGFDLPLIWYSLEDHVTLEKMKQASDRIIKAGIKWWDVEDFLGIRIPYDVKKRHIDLIEPQPNAFASLKALNGRMHGKQLQDLPFDPDIWPTPEQMDIIADYCLHTDLDATHSLWNTLKEPMELRRALGEREGQYFMCKSDAQIGEAIVKKRVETISGKKVQKNPVKPGTTFHYPVPAWVRFETPALQELLERVRETEFLIGKEGKTIAPDWMNGDGATIKLGSSVYSFGIGGIHSTEKQRALHSDENFVLVDADAASQYPAAILMLDLYPLAMGPEFLTAYRAIRDERIAAKKRSKVINDELKTCTSPDVKARLEKELLENQVKDKGGKIQLNGVYGKLGSRYSTVYAPHLLLSVTLTCQFSILMLVEQALAAGIDVVSGNTDGVLFRCPRELYSGIKGDRLLPSRIEEVCSDWERETGFDLEFGEYRSIYNASVNTYVAIKESGGHKRKGPIGNPWNPDKSDFDPVRGQLMKNPQMTICSDAALALIKSGTPVAETIRACRDIRQFVTVIKAGKGATWRGKYLGKTVRYYWSTDGEPIYEAEANASTGNYGKVQKSDGAAECMRLPDEFPDDIDYEKYIAETESILTDLGYYGPWVEPVKPIRITKANRQAVLTAWATAA